jgi:cold-inducible RNA-binding protein
LLCNFRKENKMKNIFVGNLSFGATEDSVRALFQAHGNVDRVSIVTDRDTGQARGFGFVEMSDNAEGDRAIAALNGTDLDGRALNVNEARPKTDRPSGGGGGGFRGNGGGGGRSRR